MRPGRATATSGLYTQDIEETAERPPDPKQLLQIIQQMGSDELLMFSTDYPHWHFDSPSEALPPGLPEGTRRKILHDNARAFYNL